MFKSLPARLISLIALTLLGFFYLVNNINYLKSILSQQNSSLSLSSQRLENRLQARSSKTSSELSVLIERQIGLGNIEFSTGSPTVNIVSLKKPDVEIVAPNPSEQESEKPINDGNSAIISR